MTSTEQLLEELRPVSFAIAYRMLGSVCEAEDIVQETLLRVHQTLQAGQRIASPRAFVTTVTTRLAINELQSARGRRERYVGDWLPEPIVTAGPDEPARNVEMAASLSLMPARFGIVMRGMVTEQISKLLLRWAVGRQRADGLHIELMSDIPCVTTAANADLDRIASTVRRTPE